MIEKLKPWQLGGLVAAIVFVFDQLTKLWILYGFNLPAKGSVEVLPFFRLSMVWNKGVSFGLFQADSLLGRLILVTFSLTVAAFLARWLYQADKKLFGFSLGLVIGGAIGNAMDRLFHGAVVDFLDFNALYFPWVFNIADSAISIGVVLLVYDSIFAKEGAKSP